MKIKLKNKYRIMRDDHLYTVQVKLWWFPITWFECTNKYFNTNMFMELDKAKKFIKCKKAKTFTDKLKYCSERYIRGRKPVYEE